MLGARGEPRRGCLGPPEVAREGKGPGRAALRHWEVREQGPLETGRGLARTGCHCLLFPGCKARGVPPSLGHVCLWGKKREEGKALVCSWVGERTLGPLVGGV